MRTRVLRHTDVPFPVTGRLQGLGAAVNPEHHRYATIMTGPEDGDVFFVRQPDLRSQQGPSLCPKVCPVCQQSVAVSGAWELALHVSNQRAHQASSRDDLATTYTGLRRVLERTDSHLRAIRSPLALDSTDREWKSRSQSDGGVVRNALHDPEAAPPTKRKALAAGDILCPSCDPRRNKDTIAVWTPEAIASHVRTWHPTATKCLWHGGLGCKINVARMGPDELATHLKLHQDGLESNELPSHVAKNLENLRRKNNDKCCSSPFDLDLINSSRPHEADTIRAASVLYPTPM